jgi:hypothetical protein
LIAFSNNITIRRPIIYVFDFVSNLENLPKWNYFVLQVTKTSPGPISAGSEFRQVRKTDQQLLRITEFDPPNALTVVSVPPSSPALTRRITFSGDNDHTQILDEWTLEMDIPPLLRPLGKAKVASAVRQNLSRLRELLETGATTLQDGRVSIE